MSLVASRKLNPIVIRQILAVVNVEKISRHAEVRLMRRAASLQARL
jgi:hypothetical protein